MMVSILVLVDFALRRSQAMLPQIQTIGFNPCFSGFRIATMLHSMLMVVYMCFNPCFSGFRIATCGEGWVTSKLIVFQSLF